MNNIYFLFYHSRYEGLSRLLVDSCYTEKIMGELNYFYVLWRALEALGVNIIHCGDATCFYNNYIKLRDEGRRYYLIMDYRTIPELQNILGDSLEKIYCMCYWGRNCNNIGELGVVNNCNILLKNVLTPFDYGLGNRYLGFSMDMLCETQTTSKYSNIGLIWGKCVDNINIDLIRFLTGLGVKLYSVCEPGLGMSGVVDLGLLARDKWKELLYSVSYILGSGTPKSGTTILEALYYNTVIIAPSCQFDSCVYNKNIYLLDDLSYEGIYELISGVKYTRCEKCDMLISRREYMMRIRDIFSLDTYHSVLGDNNIFHSFVFDMLRHYNKSYRRIYINSSDIDITSGVQKWRLFVMRKLYPLALIEYRVVGSLNSASYEGYDYMKFINYLTNPYLMGIVNSINNNNNNNKYILLNQRNADDRYVYDTSGVSLEHYLSGIDFGIPFRYCSFDKMSVNEQYEICGGAVIFIGVHGAGNTNIIFTPSGTPLIEINLRRHWYCDPVCSDHLTNKISINSKCNGGLHYRGEYHKADYHNLCKLLDRGYMEITPLRYSGGFINNNPISRQRIYIDGSGLVDILNQIL